MEEDWENFKHRTNFNCMNNKKQNCYKEKRRLKIENKYIKKWTKVGENKSKGVKISRRRKIRCTKKFSTIFFNNIYGLYTKKI